MPTTSVIAHWLVEWIPAPLDPDKVIELTGRGVTLYGLVGRDGTIYYLTGRQV